MKEFIFSEAEIKARKVLFECGLVDPVDMPLNRIILGRKAFYEELPLEGKEGEIVSVEGRSIITVNSNIQYEPKKRFVAAHELGHHEMHRDLKSIFSDTEEELMNWYQAGPQETQANEFAAEFLMPSEIFYKECDRKVFEPKVIHHLADRFKVSKTAAILRFVKRGNHPVFIMFCKDNKMKWWKKSVDFWPYCPFVKNDPPPSGSVAYEVFSGKKAYAGDEAKQDVWKSDWFEMKEDEQDSKFFEYCLHAPSYNYTISIVWEK
ncbi:MAG: ImmA/IrrE family metallo-endopeptidase [Chitinophagaceae bacterium]